MLFRNVVDELHDENRLTNTSAAEQTDFTALCIGGNQVDNLNAGFQNFCGGFLLVISRSGTVNRPALHVGRCILIIHRLTQQVKDTAQGFLTHGNRNGTAGVHSFCAANQTVGAGHGNAAHNVITDVLCHLQRNHVITVFNGDGVQQPRQLSVGEANVQHRSNDLDDCADILLTHWQFSFS